MLPTSSMLRHVSRGLMASRHYYCTENIKPTDAESTSPTFAKLLRNSTFVQMGDPVGKVCNFKNKLLSKLFMIFLVNFKVVVGKIYHVVDDDLYIDFGSKVCEFFFLYFL